MRRMILFLVVFVFLSVGCESMGEKTKKGAGIGALTGAAIGGIVGHQGGHGWEGALIGGAAGAVAGGAIGNTMEDKEEEVVVASGRPMALNDIIYMVSKGSSDDEIIAEIKRTGSTFDLNTQSLLYLKDNNVSDKVIDHILANN